MFRRSKQSSSGATALGANRQRSSSTSGASSTGSTSSGPTSSRSTGAGSGATATGKGRATPTRREAEAAARARARSALDPKLTAKTERAARAERSRLVREGMKSGDERYLPARDRGPLRRFIRDYVDSRLSMAELSLPLLASSLLLSSAGFAAAGGLIINVTLLMVLTDAGWMRFRLRRQLTRRFPQESLKGTTFYAITRSLQMRFLRLPKPQVKIGQSLADRYR